MTKEGTGLPELPEGWVWAELGQVTEILFGYGFPKKYQGDLQAEIPFYKVSDISRAVLSGNAHLKDSANYVSPDVCGELRAKPLPAGTVVFAKIGEAIRLNRRAILTQDSLVDNNVMGVHSFHKELSKLYIFYFLQTIKLGDYSRATTVPSLRKTDVAQIPVPLPPLLEQQRIVAKIEELFTQLDAGVAALEKARAQLRRYRQAVLKAAVEGELTREWREAHRGELEPASVLLERILEERRARWEAEQLEKEKMRAKGKVPKDDKWKRKYKEPSAADWGSLHELPDGWVWVTLEQIAKDTRIGIVRSLRQQNAEGRGAAYIKMNNVTMDGRVLLDDLVFVETSKDELRRYGIRKGDVLFNTRNSVELVGKTGLVRQDVKDTVYNNNLMRIRATGGVFPEFLVYQMCSNSYRRRLERVKRATTNVAALYAKDMLPLPMVLPPTTEQRAIADEVERRLSVIDDLERAVEQSLKRAERLCQSILKRAFEGKLVPQDPSDEPASVLLEHIKAEKARREVSTCV